MADEKIWDSEILDDEELEEVSGGGTRQLAGDNDLLKMLGCTHYDGTIIWDLWASKANRIVTEGWAQVGIKMELNNNEARYTNTNHYYLNGTEISRKEAFTYAMKQRGWNQVAIDCFDWDNVKGAW